MDRRPIALAAALMAAPLPALAQTWPGMAVVSIAGTSAATLAPRTFVAVSQAPQPRTPLPDAATPSPAPLLKLQTRAATGDARAPAFEIPAKDAWSDDQGLRLNFTKLSYKRRF